MTLLEYRIFHTVTQQGSFARAAQILHLTPSAISHAVSSMEESCGFSLFVRGKGGVSLTRSGEALYPFIRQVLSADEALSQTIGELNGVQRGTAGRQDTIEGTVRAALPGWLEALKPGGALAMSFNTYVTKRASLERALEAAGFELVQTPSMEHWVEQAISRDVLLARRPL